MVSAGMLLLFLALTAQMAIAQEEATGKVQSPAPSGPRVGALLSPFQVVKCGGGDETTEVGEHLCYRSKNGIRRQVIVFVREGDRLKAIVPLAEKLEKWAKDDQKHRAFINVLGGSMESAKKAAKSLSEKVELKAVPIVVPDEFETGPEQYGLLKEKELTVLVVKGGRVKHVTQDSRGEAKKVAEDIMTSVKKHLR